MQMDIRRTVLWVVFSLSLLILYDNWMRYNGKPSMFFPTATQTAQPAAPAAQGGRADVPQATQAAAAPSPAVVPGGPVTAKSEVVTITTDVIKADIDTSGAELRRLELLKHKDPVDPTKNMVLFESGNAHTYVGQTGLIGGPFPN